MQRIMVWTIFGAKATARQLQCCPWLDVPERNEILPLLG